MKDCARLQAKERSRQVRTPVTSNQHDVIVCTLAVREWSLITGRGGATKREGGGHVKFTPAKRGGTKSFSHAEGRAQKVLA